MNTSHTNSRRQVFSLGIRRWLSFSFCLLAMCMGVSEIAAKEKRPRQALEKAESEQNKRKSSSQTKSKKTKAKTKSSSKKLTAKDYAAMPYETWESPSGKSELGLVIEEGFVQPYPYDNLMRLFDGNRCRHRAVDIGHVGEDNGGLGTVINAVTRSEITLIGRTGEDVKNFGRSDKRRGHAVRSKRRFPRQILVPGYGVVYPFSRNYGRWRSGMTLVTKVVEGRHAGLVIRYMHMADIRRDLKVGDIVEAGEHIAIMGATAIMDSHPHVHIDFAMADGTRVDPAPYIGLPAKGELCRAPQTAAMKARRDGMAFETDVEVKAPIEMKKSRIKKRPRSSYVGKVSSPDDKRYYRSLPRL